MSLAPKFAPEPLLSSSKKTSGNPLLQKRNAPAPHPSVGGTPISEEGSHSHPIPPLVWISYASSAEGILSPISPRGCDWHAIQRGPPSFLVQIASCPRGFLLFYQPSAVVLFNPFFGPFHFTPTRSLWAHRFPLVPPRLC